jgi:hypothetical protein
MFPARVKVPMYSRPWFLFNRHLETIYPALFRRVQLRDFERQRITTPDNDFLDLDWLKQGAKKIIVISHGLEGNSQRAYIKGMARVFFENGFDVVAWNYRGCSGEMNKALRFYHSGATDDLATVTDRVVRGGYESVFLIGFSLGGNLTLKYAGERELHAKVKGVVAFSVPLDLYTSSLALARSSNWIYSKRFLKSLKKKIRAKGAMMEGLNVAALENVKTLRNFDDVYTGPIHGFADALDYYKKSSALGFLEGIRTPTLIVNAQNDPFLSHECFPEGITNQYVQFEAPVHGGHVGFASFNGKGLYWSELRALDFVQQILR